MTKPKRAVIYARVSRDEQRDNSSLGTQVDVCTEYAEKHGYEIVEIFREDFTGTKTRRPEMNKVIALAHARKIDAVIVSKVDRLTRAGAYPLGWFMTEFADHGVRVDFVIEPPDESPEGKALAGFRASSAEREVKEIERRTKDGLRDKAKAGKPIGRARAPFGLRYKPPDLDPDGFPIKSTVNAAYEPNPATIDALRLIFDQADRGVSLRKIARGLDELGVAPPYADRTKARIWGAPTVRHILTNRAYIGEGVQFAVRIEEHTDPAKIGKKKRVKRAIDPDGDGAIPLPPGVFPIVVDPAQFERVQRRLELNKRESQRDDRPAEFGLLRRGIARCGHCNSALRVNYNGGKDPDGREATYGCQTNQRRRHGCAPNDIGLNKLDREVWAWIVALRNDPRLVERFTAHLRDDSSGGEAARMLIMLDVRIAEIDKQRVTLTKRLGLVDDDTAALVADELGRLSTQRKAVAAQRERYSAKAEADEKRRARIDRTIELVTSIAELDSLSYGQKRRILGDLGAVVHVWPNGHTPRWGMTLAFHNDRSRVRVVGDDQLSVVWENDDDFGEATFYLSSPRARTGTRSRGRPPGRKPTPWPPARWSLPAPIIRAGS